MERNTGYPLPPVVVVVCKPLQNVTVHMYRTPHRLQTLADEAHLPSRKPGLDSNVNVNAHHDLLVLH